MINFDELMELAGMAGMSEAEFWQTSLRYLFNRLKGFWREKEHDMRTMYEVARYNARHIHISNGTLKPDAKMTDLGKFHWELSEAELAELEKQSEPVKQEQLKALQDKVERAMQAGTLKWGPISPNEFIK